MLSSETPRAGLFSLDETLRQNWPEDVQALAQFVEPILAALVELHAEGRFHGAVHPGALWFFPNGTWHAEHFRDAALDGPNAPDFSAHEYRAPETFLGTRDAFSDCYSFGALLCKLMSGRAPAPAYRRLAQVDALEAKDAPKWPPALVALANRCLCLEKSARFASAQELRFALSGILWALVFPSPEAEIRLQPEEMSNALDIIVVPDWNQPELFDASIVEDSEAACMRLEAVEENQVTEAPEVSEPTTVPVKPRPTLPSSTIRERLPNASVGRLYRVELLHLFGVHAVQVNTASIQLPEGFGLNYDADTGMLQGNPVRAGEFELEITYALNEAPADAPLLRHLVKLTVNPDPASLWLNKPSDPDGLYAKPDSAVATLLTPDLSAFAASLRGRSHAHEGKYRDDDFALHADTASGWHVFMAADGAGSAKFSRCGSRLACSVAMENIRQRLTAGNELEEALEKLGTHAPEPEGVEKLRCVAANFFTRAAYEAFSAIHKEAAEQKASLRDFATTFIVVLARRCQEGWFFAAFSIGDGGAGVFLSPDHVEVLTQADSGEHAGTTLFLTRAELFQRPDKLLTRTRAVFCKDFRFLAVMTDGVTDPIFPSDAAFESAEAWSGLQDRLASVADLAHPAPGLEETLLDWLKFPSPGNHDDRTLLLVLPNGTPAHE